jgi:hypothetical protein
MSDPRPIATSAHDHGYARLRSYSRGRASRPGVR